MHEVEAPYGVETPHGSLLGKEGPVDTDDDDDDVVMTFRRLGRGSNA